MALNTFERRFVINLPARVDRRREMEEQLRAVGLSAEFFPAFRFDDAKPFYRLGSRGNYMSHLAALKLAENASSILIMEDDLNFVKDRSKLTIVEHLGSDWAIFYGSHNGVVPDAGPQKLRSIRAEEEFQGSHFYAVNGGTIPALISTLEAFLTRVPDHPEGGPMPIDGALNVFRRQNPNMITLAAAPPLGYQRSSHSDCAQPKWFDRSPLTSPIIAQLRKLKNRIQA